MLQLRFPQHQVSTEKNLFPDFSFYQLEEKKVMATTFGQHVLPSFRPDDLKMAKENVVSIIGF